MTDSNARNEGEGSRTAAREYNEKSKDFIDNVNIDRQAEEAALALDRPEGEELRRAETAGRAKAREEDPKVKSDD
jgi:hypothetical protein